jgi:hypothetical protein
MVPSFAEKPVETEHSGYASAELDTRSRLVGLGLESSETLIGCRFTSRLTTVLDFSFVR